MHLREATAQDHLRQLSGHADIGDCLAIQGPQVETCPRTRGNVPSCIVDGEGGDWGLVMLAI